MSAKMEAGHEQARLPEDVTPEQGALLKEKYEQLLSELQRLESNYGRLQSLDDEPKTKEE